MSFFTDGQVSSKNLIVKTIQTMNQHLPGKRLNLLDLLEMEKPGIKGKDNSFFVLDKTELQLICDSLPRFLWARIRLPLLIEMSPDFGMNAARIQGEAEGELVSKILGKPCCHERQMIIYMPELRELRRKLPTTTQYAFIANLRQNEMNE